MPTLQTEGLGDQTYGEKKGGMCEQILIGFIKIC